MNKLLIGTALTVLAAAVPAVAPAQRAPAAAIVVVDTDRIYRECTACRTAQTQLQAQVTQAQQRAQTLGQPIQTEAQSIQTAAQAARNQQGAARTQAETALNQRVQALQTRQNTANQELARLEQNIQSTRANVVRQINERLNPVVNQVMTARGANLALDVNATLARSQALDVTNDVLAALNQQLTTISVTPLPQQQQQQQQRPQGR
jgi:Skp family chaperone for outer membrane proteins